MGPEKASMRNHNEKQRDIARSVLPSKNRKTARSRAATIKRHNRRSTRNTLHVWAKFDDALDFEGFTHDTNRSTHYDDIITMAMWERRNADKLGPIMHWAERTIAKNPELQEDFDVCRNYFKAILPDNTIGRHALGHLKDCEGFPEDPRDIFRYGYFRGNDQEEARNEALVAKCEIIIATKGAHKRFNNDVKSRHIREHSRNRFVAVSQPYRVESYTCRYCTEEARLLMGAHDIEDFVAFALEARLHHILDAIERFVI